MHLEGLELEGAHVARAQLVCDERLEIHRGERLLAIRDLLEALEGRVQRLPVDREPELLQRLPERVAPGVLAEHDRVASQAHG